MKVEFRDFEGVIDWPFVQKHVPILRVEDTCGIVAVNTDTGETIAAAIFDNWTNNSATLTLIISNPMVIRHGFMECISYYAFVEKKRKLVHSWVASNNAKALKLNAHAGFTPVLTMKDGYADGVDYLIQQLTREDCRFIGKAHSEEVAA